MQKLLLILLAIILVSSCTTTSHYNRGSLSDAMDKAKKDNPEDRKVPNHRERDPWPGDDDDRPYNDDHSSDDTAVASSGGGLSGPMYLGGRGGNAWFSSPYFDSLFDAEVLLGYRENRVEGLLFGGIKAVTAKEGSSLAESIDGGVVFLKAGIEGRYYPFPKQEFFSPYLLGQIGGLYMYWSFKNPLYAGADTITGDSVGGLILATGAGVNLIDTGSFRLGAACIPETHLFYSETHEGFQNDLFDYYGTVRWTVEMGLAIQ